MKQSSLMSFFGNTTRRKREDLEKENAKVENQQPLPTPKLAQAEAEEEEVGKPNQRETRKTATLKRPKFIDSDEDDAAPINIEKSEISSQPSSSQKSLRFKETAPTTNGSSRGNSARKTRSNQMIDEDEEDEAFAAPSKRGSSRKTSAKKKGKKVVDDDGDDGDFEVEEDEGGNEDDFDLVDEDDDDEDDFLEDDEDDDFSKKRSKSSKAKTPSKSRSAPSSATKSRATPKFGGSASKDKSASKSKPSTAVQKDEGEFINCDAENDNARASVDQLEDTTPYFALPESVKDDRQRSPTHPEYNPSTLYVPAEEMKKFTPVMKQYWDLKSRNFDKILFFKLGKFYELFYEDALVCHNELDLNWMGKKMHTGFPEKALDRMASKLIQRGYKVAVAEQTETPTQMQKRLSVSGGQKCVNRELSQVLTGGTYNPSEIDYNPRYLMAIRNFQTEFGIAILESSTNMITLAYLPDESHFTLFKTLLCQVKPQEVVFDPDNMTSDIKKIISSGYLAPQLSPLSSKNNTWHKGMAFNFLDKAYGQAEQDKWPRLLNSLNNSTSQQKKELQFEALAGLFSYLKSILIVDQVINVARYQTYDIEKGIQTCMMLDSQALQHLEIIESSSGGVSQSSTGSASSPSDGSLFGYLNRTKTNFGSRLLKSWVCAPLMDVNKINDRLDAIEDLQEIQKQRDAFLSGIEKLPDLEKICGRIYKYSIRQQNANIVYFEDLSVGRLREFRELTLRLADAEKLVSTFLRPFAKDFKSSRLRKLVSPTSEDGNENETHAQESNFIYHGYSDEEQEDLKNVQTMQVEEEDTGKSTTLPAGLLPPVAKYIKEFENYIQWVGQKGQERPVPIQGIVPSYDSVASVVKKTEQKLQQYLESVQLEMKDKTIKYGLRYELEIHEDLVKGNRKPASFEFTSKAGKYQRFQTKKLKDLIVELDEGEEHQKREMKEFCCFVFKEFYESHKTWDSLISIIAELDCLCNFSRLSFSLADGVMSRPELHPASKSTVPFMELKSARHPCLTQLGVNFIPNDVFLGDVNQTNKDSDNKSLILLTGPNMGGKSTTLRMTCLMAIMAQIGCYVPAKSLRMTAVDRIFTRIGASDKLMEGKSTFFIEMEETSNAVRRGTKHSLIIMDELGRGTSTFDGVAIAYSILRYLVEHLQSRSLFATHYHVLLDEFRHYPQIGYYHMACHVDESKGKVIFLYRLKAGECSSSFGINVAKVVGIEDKLIQKAKLKAKEFEDNLDIQHSMRVGSRFNLIVKALMDYEDESLSQETLIDQLTKIQLN